MQTVTVMIPAPLRAYAEGNDRVDLVVRTVREALEKLTTEFPGLKRHLFNEDGRLRRFVNVYLNDKDVRYLADGDRARVEEGDEIRIVPSIAGGAPIAGPP
jgi:adenylyltransferase/sulfurtransferase